MIEVVVRLRHNGYLLAMTAAGPAPAAIAVRRRAQRSGPHPHWRHLFSVAARGEPQSGTAELFRAVESADRTRLSIPGSGLLRSVGRGQLESVRDSVRPADGYRECDKRPL